MIRSLCYSLYFIIQVPNIFEVNIPSMKCGACIWSQSQLCISLKKWAVNKVSTKTLGNFVDGPKRSYLTTLNEICFLNRAFNTIGDKVKLRLALFY